MLDWKENKPLLSAWNFGNLFRERDEERRSILTGTVRAVVSDIPGIPGFAKCKLITKYKMVSAHGV